jgi:hypothetical protein
VAGVVGAEFKNGAVSYTDIKKKSSAVCLQTDNFCEQHNSVGIGHATSPKKCSLNHILQIICTV